MACKALKCVGKSMKCMLHVNRTGIFKQGCVLLAVLLISYIFVPGPVSYFIAGRLSWHIMVCTVLCEEYGFL